MKDRITICATCQRGAAPAAGSALAAALSARLGTAAEVVSGECMNLCGQPVAVSFRAPGKAAYLFGGVDPATQTDELAAFAALYAAAPDGAISDARSIGQLRFCLIGRIPA